MVADEVAWGKLIESKVVRERGKMKVDRERGRMKEVE